MSYRALPNTRVIFLVQGMTWREHGRLSLAKGERQGEGRINATQRGCKSNPSPSSSPLLRGERRQEHARELILILIDLEM